MPARPSPPRCPAHSARHRPSRILQTALLLALTVAPPSQAQNGDRSGERQPENWRGFDVPDAPALTPDAALASFRIAPGFRVELAAAEPLVVDPVAVTFDRHGRLWAVEMRSYMPTVTGAGEMEPRGQVVVLEDDDHDGRYDRSTVFLDGLVNARAVAMVEGGVLVAEPPALWYCRDVDGDLRCDWRIEIGRYGDPNPDHLEHTENGLRRSPDGWLRNAKSSRELRVTLDAAGSPVLEERPTDFRGQWGLDFDDRGRLYSNGNSNYGFVDLWPVRYFRRGAWAGATVGQPRARARNIAPDESVHSIRVNPGINRGYQKGMLRADGRLARTTSVSGGCFQRGHQFGEESRGDLFIPEPAGNVLAHFRLEETDGGVALRGTQVLSPDPEWGERAFLASTDERFRPVDCAVAPDGSLVVVDLYRGILQHRQFVTSYLAKQIEERGLATPVGLGRIWRVMREDGPIDRSDPGARFGDLAACIASLDHPNGWVRDTAQRVLTEGLHATGEKCPGALEETSAERITALRAAVGSASPWGRVHALRTLGEFESRGFGGLDAELLRTALDDDSIEVRIAGLRAVETWLTHSAEARGKVRAALLAAVADHVEDPEAPVAVQAAFTIGEFHPDPSTGTSPSLERAIALLRAHSADRWIATALLSGLAGHQEAILTAILADLAAGTAEVDPALIGELTASAALGDPHGAVPRLLESFVSARSTHEGPVSLAILDALARVAQRRDFPLVRIPTVPEPIRHRGERAFSGDEHRRWTELSKKLHVEDAKPSHTIMPRDRFGGYGKDGVEVPTEPPEVVARRRARFALCATCHGPEGEGLPALGPSLSGSPRIGQESRTHELIRLLLDGIAGPLEVDGVTWDGTMPGLRTNDLFDDAAIADIVNHLRRGLPHPDRRFATPPLVDAEMVALQRTATADRATAYTDRELRRSSSFGRPPLFGGGEKFIHASKHGGAATYRMEDGVIIGTTAPNTPNTFLCSEQVFADFDLTYEFRVNPVLNSGVQIRSRIDENDRVRGYQVEIDLDPFRARYWSGGIYEEGGRGWLDDLADDIDARMAARPDGWNPVRVLAIGGRIQVWIHGVKTADLLDAEALEGVIGLQVHGVGNNPNPLEVRWRNLVVNPLGRSDWRVAPLVPQPPLPELRPGRTRPGRRPEPGEREPPWVLESGDPVITLLPHGASTVFVHRVGATLDRGLALAFDGVRIDADGIAVAHFDGVESRTVRVADAVRVDADGRVTLPLTVILREGNRLVVTQAGKRLVEVDGVTAPHEVRVEGPEGARVTVTTCERLTQISATR